MAFKKEMHAAKFCLFPRPHSLFIHNEIKYTLWNESVSFITILNTAFVFQVVIVTRAEVAGGYSKAQLDKITFSYI